MTASAWWQYCAPARPKPDSGAASVRLPRGKTHRPGMFGKGNIGSRWLELFAREQSRFRHVPALNLCWQAWWTAAVPVEL